jgi:hypothetical protein
MSAEQAVTSYFMQVGRASVSIEFEAIAISVLLDAAPSVRTEDLGNGVLIDRDTRDNHIVAVEIIATTGEPS